MFCQGADEAGEGAGVGDSETAELGGGEWWGWEGQGGADENG